MSLAKPKISSTRAHTRTYYSSKFIYSCKLSHFVRKFIATLNPTLTHIPTLLYITICQSQNVRSGLSVEKNDNNLSQNLWINNFLAETSDFTNGASKLCLSEVASSDEVWLGAINIALATNLHIKKIFNRAIFHSNI